MELHCSLSYQIWAEFFLLHQYRYVQSRSAFVANNTVEITDIIKKKKTRDSTFSTTVRFCRILISLFVLFVYDRHKSKIL